MARVSRSELDTMAEEFSEAVGLDLFIDAAYGKVMLKEHTARGGRWDVSPRLTKGQLALWMNGFAAALAMVSD